MTVRVPNPMALVLVLLLLAATAAVIEAGSGPPAPVTPPTTEAPEPPTATPVPSASERVAAKEDEFARAPEIRGAAGFVNADSVSLERYRGEKVVLVEFWTFACYNCQNTHPYVTAWHDEYADEGLVIVGVHTPEFAFERDPDNVAEAVREAGIEYPVVLDNDRATWVAYGQRAWPTRYLVDVDGFIRYTHVGEGAYAETEREIEALLAERDRVVNGTAR